MRSNISYNVCDVSDWMTNVSKFVCDGKRKLRECVCGMSNLWWVCVFIFMCSDVGSHSQSIYIVHVEDSTFHLIKFDNVMEIEALETHTFCCAILSIHCHNGIVLMWWSFIQLKGTAISSTKALATNKRNHQNELIKVAGWHGWILSIFVHIKSRYIASNPFFPITHFPINQQPIW